MAVSNWPSTLRWQPNSTSCEAPPVAPDLLGKTSPETAKSAGSHCLAQAVE